MRVVVGKDGLVSASTMETEAGASVKLQFDITSPRGTISALSSAERAGVSIEIQIELHDNKTIFGKWMPHRSISPGEEAPLSFDLTAAN